MDNSKLALLFTAGVMIAGAFAARAVAERPSASRTRLLLESKEPVTIVCLGDSVTGIYYHSGGRRAYPELLESALQATFHDNNLRVFNAGVSGNRTADGLARLDHDVLRHKPDVVTVMFGLNDMQGVPLQQYIENLNAIVTRIQAAGAEVVLCTPNDIIDSPSWRRDELLKYVAAIRHISREHQLPLADVFAAFESLRTAREEGFQNEMNDPIHPNFNGHRRIATVLAGEIAGQSVSIANAAPPMLTHTSAKLKARQPVRIVTLLTKGVMQTSRIQQLWPEASLEFLNVESPESIDQFELAAEKVRGLKPDLVIVGVPSSAQPLHKDTFVAGYNRLLNQCLTGGEQDWDVIVALPSVADKMNDHNGRELDPLVRAIARSRDLPSVERRSDDRRSATEILTESLRELTANSTDHSP